MGTKDRKQDWFNIPPNDMLGDFVLLTTINSRVTGPQRENTLFRGQTKGSIEP